VAVDPATVQALWEEDRIAYERGRTVEDMGLKGLRVSEATRYVKEGQINPAYAWCVSLLGQI